MIQEKNYHAMSGFGMITTAFICVAVIVLFIALQMPIPAIPFIIAFPFIVKGICIISPNEAKVLTLFGKYVGTTKQNGLLWVNPFYAKQSISLRARNLN